MKRDKDRIEELEEALKQSVKITAKCEMVVATKQEEIDKQNKLLIQVNIISPLLSRCLLFERPKFCNII